MSQPTARSAYIHIPFCSYKCDFCDFTAFAGLDHLAGRYVEVVCGEIEARTALLSTDDRQVGSVFYGGGTPGLIEPALVARLQQTLCRHTHLAAEAEVSLETTPQTVTPEKAAAWLALGVNRLSIGIQSLNDDELAAIGRDHGSEQALAGVRIARRAGFRNINTDLMYGLPNQTIDSWRSTLARVLALDLPHLSAYGLQLSSATPLSRRYSPASPAYGGEDQFASMYELLVSMTAAAGLVQYEISNFARPGFESRHNLSCWQSGEYLAFGVGAHRYVGGVRSSNWRSLKRYMAEPLGSEMEEPIDADTRLREAVFLGLRTRRGIDLQQIRQQYGVDLLDRFRAQIDRLLAGGFLESAEGRLALSQKGVLVSNLVMSELI